MMDIKNILKDFSRLAEARKNHTFRTRLVFIFRRHNSDGAVFQLQGGEQRDGQDLGRQ